MTGEGVEIILHLMECHWEGFYFLFLLSLFCCRREEGVQNLIYFLKDHTLAPIHRREYLKARLEARRTVRKSDKHKEASQYAPK